MTYNGLILQLSNEVVQIILNPLDNQNIQSGSNGDNGRDNSKDEIISELPRVIQELRGERKQWQEKKTTATGSGNKKESLSENIRERRRQVQYPSFSGGSAQEAKDWLMEYNSICKHVAFTEEEKLADVRVRFKGIALRWLTSQLPEVTNKWSNLEKAFLVYFAGGENTVETALQELREL
ncbi:hypothetical protein G6F56_009326 [Rhizopus delemar]|nr:hypothetical protein G6F56_009326 [Rhizopus delemar]